MPRGYPLTEAVKDRIWELRAQGLSEAEVGRQLGFPGVMVSRYVARYGGIRPRPRRRASRCLSLEEREEVSRGIARGHSARQIARALGRSHATIVREINRCGGRARYRAHAAEREAWRRARRPRPTKLERCDELRQAVQERLRKAHSPEQIAGWLRIAYPDNESMQVSHETIYRGHEGVREWLRDQEEAFAETHARHRSAEVAGVLQALLLVVGNKVGDARLRVVAHRQVAGFGLR